MKFKLLHLHGFQRDKQRFSRYKQGFLPTPNVRFPDTKNGIWQDECMKNALKQAG